MPARLSDTATLFSALANRHRLAILLALESNETTVTELRDKLGIGQSLLSQHLAALRNARLVVPRREATFVHYSLAAPLAHKVLAFVKSFRNQE